ncbi:MAG: PhnD/SsuA/transferrin family substrate-binding protein [Deltaproteobacteria bacterium]|nr:PhnD/SsuA/transferrin family substrate-binding protein [Deltaproteobacteria bacterium]
MCAAPARTRRRWIRVGLDLALGVLLAVSLAAPGRAEAPPGSPPRFYFFSPDWRPADLNTLTERVHAALLEQGLEMSFQAFARYDDFSQQVADFPPAFLIAPGWFQSAAASDLGLFLQPIAAPLRNHRATYRKALITRSDIDSIADLTRGSIAAAVHSLGPGSEIAVLKTLHLDAGSAKVVAVPKDVDGLLALGFGQVDAALVTAQQYDLLATSNPEAAAKLQVLAFSAPIPLPGVFAGTQTPAEDRRRMAAALAKFTEAKAGREVLALLGYDAFEALQQAEAPALETPTAQAAAPATRSGAKGRKKAK